MEVKIKQLQRKDFGKVIDFAIKGMKDVYKRQGLQEKPVQKQ